MTLHIRIYDELGSDDTFDFIRSGDSAKEILDQVCTLAADLRWQCIDVNKQIYRLYHRDGLIVGHARPMIESPLPHIKDAIFELYKQARLC